MFFGRNCCLICCAVWSVTLRIDVSEEPAAPIITTIVFASFVRPRRWRQVYFKTSVLLYQTTLRHVPDGMFKVTDVITSDLAKYVSS